MVILGLDLGQVRIGYATSDPGEQLATPRGVITRRSAAQALEALVRVAREVGAELVVVGLPISLDGGLHGQAKAVQRFAERLRARINLPLVYQDERLSTVTAAEALRAAGVRPERIRERLDAAAAAIILRDFLDQRHAADTSRLAIGGS
jgi:putative Holliday junction resolvase